MSSHKRKWFRREPSRKASRVLHFQELEPRLTLATFTPTDGDALAADIATASSNSATTNTIVLPAGDFQLHDVLIQDAKLSGTTDIPETLIIVGAGENSTILDGSGEGRVLTIDGATDAESEQDQASVTVVLKDLTIQGGCVNQSSAQGGGMLIMSAKVTLDHVAVKGNHATGSIGQSAAGGDGYTSNGVGNPGEDGDSGGDAQGGGIYLTGDSLASLDVINCTFSDNVAHGGPGGRGGNGAGGRPGDEMVGANGQNGANGAAGATGTTKYGAYRGEGGNGGGGGHGEAGGEGAAGGAGGNGGAGGQGLGGAIYVAGGTLNVVDSTFENNAAFGGTGGPAGHGGDGGSGGGDGGNGGNGGQGGNGGHGVNGAGAVGVPVPWPGTACQGGPAGIPGHGGHGGSGGAAGKGGTGGDGGTGGVGAGGGIYLEGGSATLEASLLQLNQAKGGLAGDGGTGGHAGLTGGNGGNGGSGGDGGRGGTGGSGKDPGGTGAKGGCQPVEYAYPNGWLYGHGGTGGNGTPGAAGGRGGDGGNGGPGMGGGLFAIAGNLQLVNCGVTQNSALGGNGGLARDGGDGGNGGAGGNGGPGGNAGSGGPAGKAGPAGTVRTVLNGTEQVAAGKPGAQGAGGAGGAGGWPGIAGKAGTGGRGGVGGKGGSGFGGGLAVTTSASAAVALAGCRVNANLAQGGVGGAGGGGGAAGLPGRGGNGGRGGSGGTGGPTIIPVGQERSNGLAGGTGGSGGAGGNGGTIVQVAGGKGGVGGSADGGGIYLAGGTLSVDSATNYSESANIVTAGSGGPGGAAGKVDDLTGASGGSGGVGGKGKGGAWNGADGADGRWSYVYTAANGAVGAKGSVQGNQAQYENGETPEPIGDAAQLKVVDQPDDTVPAGQSFTLTVLVEDADGDVVADFDGSVTVAIDSVSDNSGTPVLGGATSVPVVDGVATFSDLTLDQSGVYTLAVLSTGLDGDVTAEFTVSSDTAAIDSSPDSVLNNQPFTVTVQAQDANGDLDDNYAGNVTLTATNASTGQTSTFNAAATDGQATFDNVALSGAGDYALAAAGDYLTDSDPANVTVHDVAAFTLQPPNPRLAGSPIVVMVEAQDANGMVDLNYDGDITIALGSNPGDATLQGSLTQPASFGTATFNDLALDEPGSGYTLQASGDNVEQTDSDPFAIDPLFAFSTPPTSAAAGDPFAVAISAKDAQGNVDTAYSGSVTLALAANPGNGTLGGTLTATAVNGLANFSNLTLNKSGTGYTLKATSGGVTLATSGGFDVTAGQATRLVASTEPPGSIAAANAFGLTVKAEDPNGNVDSTFSGPVTVALAANPGDGTLGGTLTVDASGGVATFIGLTLNAAGTGYALQASSSGLASATTSPINVAPSATALAFAAGSGAGTYGGTTTATATLTANGSPVANETISFGLNGASVGTATTDASGVATLGGISLAGRAAGSYPSGLTAVYAGDATYAASAAAADVTVGQEVVTTVNTAQTQNSLEVSSNTGVVVGSGGTLAVNDPVTLDSGAAVSVVQGGLLTAPGIVAEPGAAGINLDSGILLASANFSTTAPITIGAGGGTINSGGFLVAVAGTVSGPGGWTKTGAGSVVLLGTSQNAGGMTVDDGTLFVPDAGSLPAGGSLTVRAGGTFVFGSTPPTTTTLLSSSSDSPVYGQPLTLTATVSPAAPGAGVPAGTVTFLDGGATLGTATLGADGQATFATATLGPGSHSIAASYAGDTNFIGSASGSEGETVDPAVATSVVTASANPSVYGQSVTFTATLCAVAPGAGTPTGTVTFMDCGAILGTGTLGADGQATFSTGGLSVGNHVITVSYSGDPDFSASASANLAETVHRAAATSVVTASLNPSVYGQSVTFTATLSAAAPGAGAPTGTVTFMDGGAPLEMATLNASGQATFSTSALSAGTHAITVAYGGDANFSASASTSLAETAKQAATTSAVTASPNPSISGQSVTFTVTVSVVAPGAGAPTGTVTFMDGGATLGTSTLGANGQATFSSSALSLGSHTVTASYGGDMNFTASSGSATETAAAGYTVSTLAGSAGVVGSSNGTGGAASFNNPGGAAVDAAGDVYVADTDNQVIRKITPAGVVTVLAGSPGVAGSADGSGSAATFDDPTGVAVDSSGNVYVADEGNDEIREITPAGVVSTLAGSPGVAGSANGTGSAASFYYPTGVAVDNSGNVYVADEGNEEIREITPAGVVSTLAGSAGQMGSNNGTGSAASFAYPTGVAVDSSGNVYVADLANDDIRKITAAGVVSTLAGFPGWPGSSNGTGYAAKFYYPTGVAVDSSGNVYVAEYFNDEIRMITPAGVVTTLAGAVGQVGAGNGPASTATFDHPWGVAVDSSGNVYVADTGNDEIREITNSSSSGDVEIATVNLADAERARIRTSSTGASTLSGSSLTGLDRTFSAADYVQSACPCAWLVAIESSWNSSDQNKTTDLQLAALDLVLARYGL